MRASELHQMSDEELRAKLAEVTEERFRLRFRSATEALESPIQLRTLRKDIARIRTMLRARELESTGRGA